jgi:transcriptional regulator with XRE-family HTH domain
MNAPDFVGDRLRRLRESRHLSLMVLARHSGASWSTLYRAEVGGVMTRRTAERVAPVLGVPAADLLPRDRRPGGEEDAR